MNLRIFQMPRAGTDKVPVRFFIVSFTFTAAAGSENAEEKVSADIDRYIM